ncbi:MAG TPA: AraC family transcriptional regulator [Sphingomicrobium sp.]
MADEAHTLGFGVTYDMVATRTACGQLLTLTSHRSDYEIPPHRHTNDYLCIVLSGGFAEQEGARFHERLSGCYFTHHAGATHHDRFGPRGAMCLNLHFPAGDSGVAIDGICPARTKVTAEKLAFELAASLREELVMASLAAEIMGDLNPGPTLQDRGKWIDRLIEAISDEPGRRWTLRELAEIADRHPVRIAQAFRANTGISLGAFQRLRRLTGLSLALRHGKGSLATLAADFGYCDQSHMTSEFRAAFGTSPGRYRRDFH